MAGELLRIAVAGAHLSGLALNHQVLELGATLVKACKTAPVYRMYSIGPKPSLIRQPEGSTTGAAIEVELWDFPIENVGCVGRPFSRRAAGRSIDPLMEGPRQLRRAPTPRKQRPIEVWRCS